MNLALASQLRQQIARLRVRREHIELRLLKRRRMLRATLIERYLGSGDKKRKTPAYYLAYVSGGKTIHQYIKQDELSRKAPSARAWGEYYHLVADWVKLNQELAEAWRALGQAQADEVSADDNG